MKKILSIIVSLALCITSLLGCGNENARLGISSEMLSAGKSTLKALDDYMDAKVDYETTERKIDGLYDTMSRIYDNCERDEYGAPIYTNELSISIQLLSLKTALLDESTGHGTYDNLLNERNDFAELLGEKKRKK